MSDDIRDRRPVPTGTTRAPDGGEAGGEARRAPR